MNSSNLCRLTLLLLLALPLYAMGQTAEAPQAAVPVSESQPVQCRIVFKSGRVVTGEIVQKNEEVVIVKDKYGSRFQYPMTDVS